MLGHGFSVLTISNLLVFSQYYDEACNQFAGPFFPSSCPGKTLILFKEILRRWRAVCNTVSDLTGPRFEPHNSRSTDKCVTARSIRYGNLFMPSRIMLDWMMHSLSSSHDKTKMALSIYEFAPTCVGSSVPRSPINFRLLFGKVLCLRLSSRDKCCKAIYRMTQRDEGASWDQNMRSGSS